VADSLNLFDCIIWFVGHVSLCPTYMLLKQLKIYLHRLFKNAQMQGAR